MLRLVFEQNNFLHKVFNFKKRDGLKVGFILLFISFLPSKNGAKGNLLKGKLLLFGPSGALPAFK